MDKNIAKQISEYNFSSLYNRGKDLTVAICIHDINFEKEVKKRNVGYYKIYGYSYNPEIQRITIALIFTKEDKFWTKKNIGKLKHQKFIIVDKDNSTYLIDCTNPENIEERYLGKFSTDTLEYICPDTVFTHTQPANWFSALARVKTEKIKFSEDDSIDVFNEKLEQKYNELSNRLKRRIITQIINIAKQKGETK